MSTFPQTPEAKSLVDAELERRLRSFMNLTHRIRQHRKLKQKVSSSLLAEHELARLDLKTVRELSPPLHQAIVLAEPEPGSKEGFDFKDIQARRNQRNSTSTGNSVA